MRCLSVLLAIFLASAALHAGDSDRDLLEYAPAPADNPLKGLVPYAGDVKDRFPHSMEFQYLPFSALVKGYGEFDFKPLEALLDEIGGRGHQAIFRVYLEYPNQTHVIPEFLVRDGLKVYKYPHSDADPAPIETPDYENENLRKAMKNFIAALGRKYDGDPRIGFITAGLLGTWGEWHTFPRDNLFASKTVQNEVMDAYKASFKITPILLRYPAGQNDTDKASNAGRNFGYHDDSFAWATLSSEKPGNAWFYVARLKAAGPEAMDKWKTRPIGGEIRPEAWGKVFDDPPGDEKIQDFRKCVEATHVTWLMDSGMFQRKQSTARIKRAMEDVRRMGYEFHVVAVTLGKKAGGRQPIVIEMENRGVAPFYYDWPVELGLVADGTIVKTFKASGKIARILPAEPPTEWKENIDTAGIRSGKFKIVLRVVKPLPNGMPLRFANATQDADITGWLTLTGVDIR